MGGFASKKLAVLAGTGFFGDNVIQTLKDLGVTPDAALYSIAALVAVYLIGQSIVDFKKEGVKGLLAGFKLRMKEFEAEKKPE